MATRPTQFAGSWYPGTESDCRAQIERFAAVISPVAPGVVLHGGIVPHAGWMFSGSLACLVVKLLAGETGADLVVIFGAHMAEHTTDWIMGGGSWATPLGPVPIDGQAAAELGALLGISVEDPVSAPCDNTIELQLPFVKHFFPDAAILPVGLAPKASVGDVGTRIGEYLRGRKGRSVVLGSTDLTHYGPNYGFAPVGVGESAVRWVKEENDQGFIDCILNLDPKTALEHGLANHSACCPGAAVAALTAARAMGAEKAWEVGHTTSWDLHPGSSFVGYAGIVF